VYNGKIYFIKEKDVDGYIITWGTEERAKYDEELVNEYFSKGTWIEIPNDQQPTIHADKPRDPLNLFDMEKRIEALEAATFGSKQNLDIEDWETVECLSYEEITKIIEDKCSGLLDCTDKDDIEEFKAYIKQKLNK